METANKQSMNKETEFENDQSWHDCAIDSGSGSSFNETETQSIDLDNTINISMITPPRSTDFHRKDIDLFSISYKNSLIQKIIQKQETLFQLTTKAESIHSSLEISKQELKTLDVYIENLNK